MFRPLTMLLLVFSLMMFYTSSVVAQSITVTPDNGSVGVSQTLQYKATVTGSETTAVTWLAGGISGGNASVGTISTTGLYTAPANLPGQNPVQITAKSSTLKGSTFVTILSNGPVITAVNPNPLNTGTITVTIMGTGFQQYASVMNGGVQLSTISVTPTTVVATGYQGAAPSATFKVKNPGSVYSNSITVPVSGGGGENTHTLTVNSGTGSGNYAAGAVVNISANAPAPGQSFVNWTGAAVANANAASTTLVMPNVNTSVTAKYSGPAPTHALTVVNGTGSGNYTAGTVVNISANAPPAGQYFSKWTGAAVLDPFAANTTITMPSAAATVTATYAPAPIIPFPVTTHPRLWVTQQDLPKLQSWANANNPIYQNGMKTLLNTSLATYNNQFFPGGVQNATWPDPGDVQGYQLPLTEHHALILAFNSLIDPSPANRILYAKYARNLIMVALNEAAKGHLAGAPFRDPLFAVYNRGNGSSEMWPLVVDWIYSAKDGMGNNILTSADKLTIRNVFMMWANDCLHASTTGGDHPAPIGVTNSMQLLPGGKPYRMSANNYYLGHSRLLTMMSLAIDPVDDPRINPAQPASLLGNSLRSYILDANGAWLFQEFAMYGDAPTVANAYGIQGNGAGFGLASGGLPPEGMLYGHSFSYVLGQLLALQTAGFNSQAYAGPQIQLIGAPMWDRFVNGMLGSIIPAAIIDPNQSWLGQIYQVASYGDLLRLWITPDYMQPFALLALLDAQNGKTNNMNAARWWVINAVEGGAAALNSRITQPFYYSPSDSILYYLLLDPGLPAPTDPRPGLPTVFVDQPAGRILARTDWGPLATTFDYRASWISINHQLGDAGQFELYRRGEWLTKEMSNYDNNAQGLTTVYHNTLAIQNWCANGTPNLQWYEANEWANGSQWMLGLNAGDPTTVTSNGSGFVYANSDLTPLYNRPNFWTPVAAAVDVTQATRSIIWLNNDYIVVYDRATTNHSNLFKRFHLSLVNSPVVNGNSATQTLNSGQKLSIQTLLPANPLIKSVLSAPGLNPIAWGEPTRYTYTVEEPTHSSNARFLHVLQAADPGAPVSTAVYLQSTAGTAFDGTAFGSCAAFFPVNSTGAFAATTFTVPGTVHTLKIAGLAAGAQYTVAVQTVGGNSVVTVTPGGAGATTDNAGLLSISL
ncbi:MAG: hypothetical protein ABJA67_11140 [Chthonomonadales bacterium]